MMSRWIASFCCFTVLTSSNGFLVTKKCPKSPTLHVRDVQLYQSMEDGYYDGEEGGGGGTLSASNHPRGARPRMRPIRPVTISKKVEKQRQETQARHMEALKDPTLLTNVKFSESEALHPATKRGLTDAMGLQVMTEIQAKSLAAALDGKSILGSARTGTGKTLAFLIPIVERLLETDLSLYRPGHNIGAIIVAPTRELAIQIADQAEALLTFHKGMTVSCIYGGTKIQRDYRYLSGASLPSILVATPGRLLEHLENTRINRRKFCDIAEETKIIVLDETDRLFEAFSKETKRILSFLPRTEKRQTLLYSATIPNKLRGFLKGTMKIEFTEIDCVTSTDSSTPHLNYRVSQTYHVISDMDRYVSTLVSIVSKEMDDDPENHKIIVFFPASKLVRFFTKFFQIGLRIPVLEIHSRMSQASRSKASNSFRSARRSILFTSDVSARGVDYPEVSLVVQFGAPTTENGYVHRLGRTGRAGREGKGLLILLPFEKYRLKSSKLKEIQPDRQVNGYLHDIDRQEEIEELIAPVQSMIQSGHADLSANASAAYKAFLAYYIANSKGLSPSDVLDFADTFARQMGLSQLPAIEPDLAKRLGVPCTVEDNTS